MGVNISIVDMNTGKEVPGWDSCRYGGDSDLLNVLSKIGYTSVVRGDPREGVTFERPEDVEVFRAALHIAFDFNTERWDQMCDMLAADPNRALYFSY